jgi:outer membrane protein assembly factor BamB
MSPVVPTSRTALSVHWTFGIVTGIVLALLVSTLAAGVSAAVGSSAAPAPLSSPVAFHATVVKSSADDWPELHQSPNLNGYVRVSPLSSTNASSFGVAWSTDLYGAALDSPVVAYDPILGETLAYIGTENGNVLAINVANGQIVWGVWVGSTIRSTPLVNDGALYIATFTTDTVYKLNATTGAVDCSLINSNPFEATPTFATPRGGVPTLYLGGLDSGSTSAAFLAINASNCQVEWRFTGYNQTAGSWDSASYGVTKGGVPLVLFGTDNPDSSVYALNALTGTEVWRFQCYNPGSADDDVAAGAAITPPGKNGFAQGVAYVTNKAGRAYALDLNNGTLIWETNFDALAGTSGVARSTPAIDGTSVVFGWSEGLYDLNAVNGSVMWKYVDPTHTESISSPAIGGTNGHGIAVTADVGGSFDVVAMVGGTQLYTYALGGYVTGSPAISGTNVIVVTDAGYLYDFAVGGGNDATLPSATISSPSSGSMLANPNGNLTVTGTATDPKGVASVEVAIQSNGVGGPWWNGTSATWKPGPADTPAVLASPGAKSTTWSLSFPVPRAGGTYEVIAYANSVAGQSGLNPPSVDFAVNYSTSGPYVTVSTPFIAPGGNFTVSGGGFGASEKVKIEVYGKTLGTPTTKSTGVLGTTKLTLSSGAAFGETSVTATGETSGKTTTVAITVTNDWDQLGYSAGRAGYEPNDPLPNTYTFPGAGQWVYLAWHFDDGGVAMNASPAIVDDVAYVADTAGQLFALDTANGGLLWTFTLASGQAIDGSPAVDAALGLVYVGANDGTLDAIYLANGTLAWSVSIGGDVAAPALSGSTLYVTSNSGAVAALAASTGSSIWSTTLASAIGGGAALNASAKLLVVGEANGDVVGLNSSSGATRWTYSTSGAIVAGAMIAGGLVYVGSSNHDLYALNQTNGHLKWSFATHGAIADTPSIDGIGYVFIGSDDGYFYVLSATTGKQHFNYSAGSPVIGISSVKGVEVFEESGGTIGAEKTFVNGGGWKFATGGPLITVPVILDGAIFVAAGNGNLYAFTQTGSPPV